MTGIFCTGRRGGRCADGFLKKGAEWVAGMWHGMSRGLVLLGLGHRVPLLGIVG